MKIFIYTIRVIIWFLLLLLSFGLYELSKLNIFIFFGGLTLIGVISNSAILLVYIISMIQNYFNLYNERKKKRKRMEKINTEKFSTKL